MEGKDLLFKLSNGFGVSGNEQNLHSLLEKYFSKYTDEIKEGRLGDFCAVKYGTGNRRLKVMIAAHLDEIGLIVKNIDDRGFIHFTNVGGVDLKTLPAQEVIIHGKKDIYGVIGVKPPHVLSEEDMEKTIKKEDMLIDTGMTSKELKQYVSVGDFITMDKKCTNLLGDFITGKAMDNRAGICAMFECARELEKLSANCDVYYTATTMEEIGAFGAETMTYEIQPDIAIAVDVTFADSYADSEIQGECGKGVEISIGPNLHPELSKRLIKVADDNNIPYFIEVYPGNTGTDAWEMQISREGVPTLLLSVPIRYMHSPIEVVKYEDIKSTGRLLALFISSLKGWDDYYAD